MKNKRILIFVLIIISPFLVIILTNESVRFLNQGKTYHSEENISKSEKETDVCSWACHNNTQFCKQSHVKFATPYFNIIDPIYFGIINSLKSTGNYGLANIILLVILIPAFLFFLLLKSINIERKIRKIKKASSQ